jgi:YD repeat-containing protein
MPKVTAHLQSPLQPAEVLRILTDFGPERSKVWPGVDDEHLMVHEQGEGFADVTEGNDATWERERYTWTPDGKKVAAETTESNVWAVGSRWDYTLTPVDNGTLVTVTLTRFGKNLKGKLFAALLPILGRSVVTKSLSAAFQASGT